ncbi:MAG: stage V sporulation protein AD [Ruminococcaceae bacterium]|nr:stage V sporulation protein AD [Oscillospiraceae bacterium]
MDVIKFENKPRIVSVAAVGGKHEKEGPLGMYLDMFDSDDRFGADTWEKSESEMTRHALRICLEKANLKNHDVELIFGGDLLNQCCATTFGINDSQIPFYGIYGACSTFTLGLSLSAMCVNAGYAKRCASTASSHFCSSERQFRTPVEYGSQRAPTSQWTVTGSACTLLSDIEESGYGVYVNEALAGRIVDPGINDVNNMGAAMAPAAADTLKRYFEQSGKSPDDFDVIATGDLGYEGYGILKEMLGADGIKLGDNYTDCGLLIYNRMKQEKYAGGSGCGCSAVVTAGYFMEQFKKNKIRDALIISTGALLSATSTMQGLTIPGIAHLVRLTHV